MTRTARRHRDRRQRLLRPGHGEPAAARGREDFVILERGGRRRRHLARQHLPGLRLRRAQPHLLASRSRPTRTGRATYSPQPEIQRLPARRRRATRACSRTSASAARSIDARWDGDAQPGSSRRRRASSPRPRARRRRRAAVTSRKLPSVPGLARVRGRRSSTRPAGTTTTTSPASASRSSAPAPRAIQFVPEIQPRSREPAPLPAHRAVGAAAHRAADHPRRARALPARSRRAARDAHARSTGLARRPRSPMLQAALSRRAARALGKAHLRRQVRDPELRAQGSRRTTRPAASASCSPTTTTRRSASRTSRSSPRASPRCAGTPSSAPTAPSARSTRSSSAPASTSLDMPIAERVRDARRAHARRALAGQPQAHRGATVAGFPNMFLLLGPNTGARATARSSSWRRRRPSYVLEALARAWSRRGIGALERRRRRPAPRGTTASSARMQGTVWLEGGCASWYLDANGLNTSLWPDFAFRFSASCGLRRPELRGHPGDLADARGCASACRGVGSATAA